MKYTTVNGIKTLYIKKTAIQMARLFKDGAMLDFLRKTPSCRFVPKQNRK